MSTIALVAIILTTVIFVALPYVRKNAFSVASSTPRNGRLADLYGRRDNLLAAIKELEFDRDMGKVSREDFREMNTRYRREAAEVLEQIDSTTGQRRSVRQLEDELRRLRLQQKRAGGVFCSFCGEAVGARDSFCSHCGNRVHNHSS